MGDPFGTNADPALVELFRAESDTHIPVLSQGLLAMEKGQADDQSVASMMRAAHSIKGAARIVGIGAAVRVAHVMEDCFTAAKEKRSILSSDAVDVLLAGVDALQRICALQPEADMTEAWLEAVVGQLTAVKEGKTVASAAPPAPVATAPIDAPPARVEGQAARKIVLPAQFDDGAAEALRGRLLAAFDEGTGPIEIDFGPVKSVSAGGLALLASAVREAARHDPVATLTAHGASGAAAAMFRVTALDRTLGPGAGGDAMAADSNQQQRYVVEAREHLAALSAAIVELERGAADPAEQVARILRSAHSLKGGAGFSGLTTIERLAHAMETAVENIRDGHVAVNADVIDTLLFALDRLSALTDDVEHSQDADISAPLKRLEPLAAGRAGDEPTKKIAARNITPVTKPAALAKSAGAAASEFPISPRVLEAWERHASFLYGVKMDWFEAERELGLSPLEVARRIERAGTSLDARMELAGPALADGLPTPPLWYWTIVSSGLPPEKFAQQLEISCAAIVRLESVANKPQEKKPDAAGPAGPRGPAASGSLRIPVTLIDRMMSLAGELVLVRNQAKRSTGAGPDTQRQLLRRLDALTNEMQDAALRMRMQPVGALFDRFPRLVRDLARQLGKQIDLEIAGADVELDKTVLETLTDPLTHLVRNCCDHGIETPAERGRAGKSPNGLIRLTARQERGQIVIQIRDDGRGLDRDAIKRKALQQGVKQRDELDRMSEREVNELILMSGFSTASRVTDLSGRGVGMDVVRTNLEQIGGTVEIDSVFGEGATFTLRLPLTMAILPCLLLASGGERFAIPLRDVEEVVLLRSETKTRIECADDEEVLRLRGKLVPVARLAEVLRRRNAFSAKTCAEISAKYHEKSAEATRGYVAILRFGALRFGLVVDDVLGSEEIVVKPLHPLLRRLGSYGAATILGDGRVVLILSCEGLARHSGIVHRQRREGPAELPDATAANETGALLLFRFGATELFAIPLGDVRRIVSIRPEQIERVGEREMIAIDGTPTNVLRLDRFLRVSQFDATRGSFLILPRAARAPAGFLASEIVDTPTLDLRLDDRAYWADGILGSGLILGQIAIFLDVFRLIAMWEMEHGTGTAALPGPAARKRVLVVEDTEFFRRLVTSYLAAEGWEVAAAGSGAEGLEKLNAEAFDAVVSDIEMPIMDGLTLAREVRRDGRFDRLPMLALTSLSSEEDRRKARSAGFDAYEVKLNRETFLETIRALLASGRPAALVAGGTRDE